MPISLMLVLPLLLQGGLQGTSSIRGSVTVEGLAIGEVIVYLEGSGSRPVEQVFTDWAGNFVFDSVASGTYYVRIKQAGFEEFTQRIEVPAYDREVMVFLQRDAKIRASDIEFGPGSRHEVDVRQLSLPAKAVDEYRKALREKRRGKTENAIRRLRLAVDLAPNFVEAAFHLGSMLCELDLLEDAEATLKQALITSPMASQLRLMLANVLVKERKYQQALAEIDTYLANNPLGPDRQSAELTRSQLLRAIQP